MLEFGELGEGFVVGCGGVFVVVIGEGLRLGLGLGDSEGVEGIDL